MGIEYRGERSYYYRKVRVGDRLRSEYICGGELAPMARALDRHDQLRRRHEANLEAIRIGEIEAADRLMQDHFDAIEAVAREAIEAAGYRRTRGQWRKRRDRDEDPGEAGDARPIEDAGR
jgi:hypothetical protein